MLDFGFSAAFSTVDHNILIHRLKPLVGISETALEQFYFTDRIFSVSVGGLFLLDCFFMWRPSGIGPGAYFILHIHASTRTEYQ